MEKIEVASLESLSAAAAEILERLDKRHIIVFRGEMGAGKTTLIREICALLGVDDTVTSPTFALINEYRDRNGETVYHFDFYRINRIEEAFDLGYEEYFYGSSLCLVEWPEKIETLLPDEVMTVTIRIIDENRRTFTMD